MLRAAFQTAVVYNCRSTAHNFAADGFTILRTRLLPRMRFQGSWNIGFLSVADFNGNGKEKLLTVTKGTNAREIGMASAK
jgi:hypothetical protein